MHLCRKTLSSIVAASAMAIGLPAGAHAGCMPCPGSDGNNTCIGTGALAAATSGYANTAVGTKTLTVNTTGSENTGIGFQALLGNTSGNGNTATGVYALQGNTTGEANTAAGLSALYSNVSGARNTATGGRAMFASVSGSNNVALGYEAGMNWITGSDNIAIGAAGADTDSATIRIGAQGVQKRAFIAGIRGTGLSRGLTVRVNAQGQLGIVRSARRYKEDIQPMGDASDSLMKLRPVTFRYKEAEADGSKPVQYGLIAEEVEQALPDLVVYNPDGTPESVAYDMLPSLLLNEYQKQNGKLAATEAKLVAAETRLAAVEAELAAMRQTISRLAAVTPQGSSLVALGAKETLK